MSLVSVGNLLSPFRNKAQTVGLLVLAFLVFVVRWVGSSDPAGDGSAPPSVSRQESNTTVSLKELQLETAAFLDSQSRSDPSGGARPAPLPGDESLDEQLAYRASPEDELPTNSGPTPGRSKDLADIRKRLGIE
jgi:hypothetical protein